MLRFIIKSTTRDRFDLRENYRVKWQFWFA